MSSCCVVLASAVDATGTIRIPRSDAAAVHAAVSCGLPLAACCAAGDITAAEYALAAGIRDVRIGMQPAAADCELVWIGTGAMEHGGDAMAAQIAEDLNASLLFDVLECRRDDSQCVIIRDAGRGSREVLLARGPLVLVVSDNAARPPYVSRYRRQQSRRLADGVVFPQGTSTGSGTRRLSEDREGEAPAEPLPCETSTLSAAQQELRPPETIHGTVFRQTPGVSALYFPSAASSNEWQISRPRPRVHSGPAGVASSAAATDEAACRLNSAFGIRSAAPSGMSSTLIAADPETSARQLLRYLVHHGFVQAAEMVTDELRSLQPAGSRLDQPDAVRSQGSPPGFGAGLTAELAPEADRPLSSRILRRPRLTGDSSTFRVRRQPRSCLPARPTALTARNMGGDIARRPRPCGQALRPSRGPFPQ